MASGSSSSSIVLSAASVSWGRRECNAITVTVAATALDGKYFLVDALSSNFGTNVGYAVWFNLDAASTDPAVAGRTGIEVNVVTGDTAAQVATKLSAALEAHANFYSSVSGTEVIMEGKFKGAVTTAAVDVDTTFTFVRARVGLGGDLGKTSGGVSITTSASSVEIKADQSAELVLDEVFTGASVSASMSLLEMTPARWKTIVGSVTGDTYTPMSGTEVVGYGESRLYQSLFELGGELVLHPTRYPSTDRSYDITIPKCAPKPASFNFSGTEPSLMEVEFVALADRSINSAINLMVFGDSEQDLRA